MFNLKIATIEDYDLVEDMVMKFLLQTNYKDYISKEQIKPLLESFLTSDGSDKIILLNGTDGMLAGIASKMLLVGPLVATEVAWWVEPDKRKSNVGSDLLEAFEYWASKIGCSAVTMISLDKSLDKYYEKRGYSLYERAFTKEIK